MDFGHCAPSLAGDGAPQTAAYGKWLRVAIIGGGKAAHACALRLARHGAQVSLPQGRARFLDATTIEVVQETGATSRIIANRVLVATGARPFIPDIPGLSGTPYWTASEACTAARLPDRLIVLGSSVSALELAQAFLRRRVRVTLLARGMLLAREDPAINHALTAAFRAEGMKVIEHADIRAIAFAGGRFRIATGAGRFEGERLLVAAGSAPNTESLGLEAAGVATDARGAIRIDEQFRTTSEHIYAAGECTDHPQPVGEAAGTRVAENMLGDSTLSDPSATPSLILTDPQVATVGLDERAARARGIDVDTRTVNLGHARRVSAGPRTRGFVKLIAEARSGRLLGAQIVAREAGEMIQSVVQAIRHRLSVYSLAGEGSPRLTTAAGLRLCAQTFMRARPSAVEGPRSCE